MRYYSELYGLSPKGLELLRRIVATPLRVDGRGLDYRILNPLRKKGLVCVVRSDKLEADAGWASRSYPAYYMVTARGYDTWMNLVGVLDVYAPPPPSRRRLKLVVGGNG